MAIAGRSDEAIDSINKAARLSPNDAAGFSFEAYRALAHFHAGPYPEARDSARAALSFNTNDHNNQRATAYQHLAASLAQLGDFEAARSALEELS